MATVAQILASRSATFAWLFTIEGCPVMFTDRPELVGSGAGSWIGTTYGARRVVLGLVPPNDLQLSSSWPAESIFEEHGATMTLADFDGVVVDLFRAEDDEESTEDLWVRLAPTDDPAPETVPGALQSPVVIWDRHIGIEAIGPAGERRHFWCWPSDGPPGLDHPGGDGWAPIPITTRPIAWAGRKCCLYMLVYDPDSGTWPSWQDQHDGGALLWWGAVRDFGTWKSIELNGGRCRALDLHLSGPVSWVQGSLNNNRPQRWIPARVSAILEPARGNHLIAAWIEDSIHTKLKNDGWVTSIYNAQTFASGNDLDGLTTRAEIAERVNAIVRTMATGTDVGGILASSNATWEADLPWQGALGDEDLERDVRILGDGTVWQIKNEGEGDASYLCVCMHKDVWAVFGWEPLAQGFFEDLDESWFGTCPVGGEHWGEDPQAAIAPAPGYLIGRFPTIGPGPKYAIDNDGDWRSHTAMWPAGTVVLGATGGDIVRLGVGVVPCEGQLVQPPPLGIEIDGEQCTASGWWLFRGPRLTREQYLAGDEPERIVQVALCDWVATSDGLGIEIDSGGWSSIRVRRWEHPHRFGLHDQRRFRGTWATAAGALEVAPIAVFCGVVQDVPDRAHHIPVRIMLSSGTATNQQFLGGIGTVPGSQHPDGQIGTDKVAGDMEVRDLGLGLPLACVDWNSFNRCAMGIAGGKQGALNRSMHAVFGPAKADRIMREILSGRGWAWTWRRRLGEAVPKYGVIDPTKPLAPGDAELTIGDATKAGRELGDWDAIVKLRETGPFDRYKFRADRSPLAEDDWAYELLWNSADPFRRHRHGKIDWQAGDGGMRDPGPWLGTPSAALMDWTGDARERFSATLGRFWAKRLMYYTTVVDATVAHRCWIGTIVRVIDARAETPQGTRGLDHLGWIIEARQFCAGQLAGARQVTVLLQPWPVAQTRVWGPSARLLDFDAETGVATISEDWANRRGSGVLGWRDTMQPWVEPIYSEVGGAPLRVRIHQSEQGVDYPSTYAVDADVIDVDVEANTITLANLSGGDYGGKIFRDMIKFVIAAPYAEQTDWAAALFAPLTDAEGYYTLDPATKGRKLK